jgi:hypothetical protein
MPRRAGVVTVASYTDAVQAHLARGRLEAEGIPATLAHEHHVWADWMMSNALGGVKVQVPVTYRERAQEILGRHDRGEYELPIPESDIQHCPKCGSTTIEEDKTTWKIAFLGLFIFHVPLPFRRGWYKCKTCAHSWMKER